MDLSVTRSTSPRLGRPAVAALVVAGLGLAAPAFAQATATLVRADFDKNGVIDFSDLNAFFNAYSKNAPSTDVDGDGSITANDINTMVSLIGKRYSLAEAPKPETPAPQPGESGGNNGGGIVTPPPVPQGDFYSELLPGQRAHLTHAGRTLIQSTTNVYRPYRQRDTEPRAETTIVPQANGFDLVVRVVHNGRREGRLGSIVLDGIRLGPEAQIRDFRTSGHAVEFDSDTARTFKDGFNYPSQWYSPVFVVSDDTYTFGVSLQYPVLEYKHEVRVAFTRNTSGVGSLVFDINDTSDGPLGRSASDTRIAPGEVREYVLTVRAVTNDQPWIETLEPYREYFASMYGDSPRYRRDARPVQAAVIATATEQSRENPQGFLFEDIRPDAHGWQGWGSELSERFALGWSRAMIFRPTGLNPSGARRQNCAPFQFVSGWLDNSEAGGPMADAFTVLPNVARGNNKLGLWWGEPVFVSENRYDPSEERLNPDKTDHVERALGELLLAQTAGATMVGLDSFNRMPAWDAFRWLERMQQEAPGVSFITEPTCGDIIHALAPAVQIANGGADGKPGLEARFYLADYLLPGHETWAMVRHDLMAAAGQSTDDAALVEEMERLTEQGYVPMLVAPVRIDSRLAAEETWRSDEW